MKRKWIKYYDNGVQKDYVLRVNVQGVAIQSHLCVVVGEHTRWQVNRKTGDLWWCPTKGKAKTLDAAKAKAEAAMERLVDKAIKGLQKWRGK